jgi:uncharacterized protein (TIGR00725 family)
MTPPYVAVVGPGEATAAELSLARELGAVLAQRGAVVLTGGLGGVMAAAIEGAAAAGGLSVGLLPGGDRDVCAASVVIPTGLGELRNGLLVRAADAVIAVGGSWGTLSEMALARRTGVPVVRLGGWDVPDVPRVNSPEEAAAWALAQLP